ncbi:hypothetical protein PPACK8108_LOCUS5556 [Phakopsora pachyrhizi]|uniref:Uncharacterized protein n=1 Tax=Phakopsora pachyrhizi TaxID=170000 RepID=A0AAV0ASI1_PHAPC|nr:hypothetical protein PPACK8108_LOCUS5556 [Phakopsora pachyrhizi]
MTNGSHSSLPVSTAVVHQSIIQSDLTRAKSLNTHTNNPTTTTTTIDSNHSSDSSTSPETNHPQPEQHQPEANRVDPDCQPDLLVSQQPSDSVLPSTGEHQISGNCESINQIQTHYNHPSNINSNLLRTSPLNSDSETVSLVLSLSRGGTFREEGDEPDDEEEEETETLTSSNDNHTFNSSIIHQTKTKTKPTPTPTTPTPTPTPTKLIILNPHIIQLISLISILLIKHLLHLIPTPTVYDRLISL